ncbi:MAG TPA: sulfite exporter TauE/SafE family protein [Planctomycetota bacterium]|jgi:hypothetical protein
MTPLGFTVLTFCVSLIAGVFGSLLGLGGGIIIVPFLTLVMGIDIHHAVGASIVSVIATSSGAAAAYVRERMTNLRVAMFLEIGTTSGALTGAYLAGVIAIRWLFIIFGVVLGYSAIQMFRKRHELAAPHVPRDPLADKLRLHGSYHDDATGQEVKYRVTHTKLGMALMYIAGIASGLLGIGSGVLKVPSMDLAMKMPIKASTATSNFMIGVTAAASAGVYFVRGDISPFITAPVMTGILIGATAGSRLLGKLQSIWVRTLFVVVLLWVSIQMLLKGAGV